MKKIIFTLIMIFPLFLFGANMNKNGIVTKLSHHSVDETVEKLLNIVRDRGFKDFTVIDHKKNAIENGTNIKNEAKLIIFSESNACIDLLKFDPAVGLDLPIKLLVYVAEDNKVYIKYRDTRFLKNIYNIGDAKEAILMSETLDKFTNLAIK